MLTIPSQGWIDIHLSEGRADVMRFVLVWHGQLPSTGNSSKKPKDVTRIRESLSPQLKTLWDTHPSLQVLKEHGFRRVPGNGPGVVGIAGRDPSPRELSQMFPGMMIDLTEWMSVKAKRYKPLVRKSLHLSCDLKITFLRQDDPGALISQGGDLDGRIKTLLDALRMPSDAEQDVAPPTADEVFCLMESDFLVTSLDVDTERLLFPQTSHPHEVHLIIEASLRVLRVDQSNYCLL